MTFRDDLSFGKSGDSKMPRGKERKAEISGWIESTLQWPAFEFLHY